MLWVLVSTNCFLWGFLLKVWNGSTIKTACMFYQLHMFFFFFSKESCTSLWSHGAKIHFPYVEYICTLGIHINVYFFLFALGYNHIRCPDLSLRTFSKGKAGCHRSWFSGWYSSFWVRAELMPWQVVLEGNTLMGKKIEIYQ